MGTLVVEGGILYAGQISPSLQVDTLKPVTGAVTSGPSLTGNGGGPFWGLAPYPLAAVPNLTINYNSASNSAAVSWPNTGDYTLQQNNNLTIPAGWATSGYTVSSNANGTNSITITPPTGNLFFRLAYP
jgi:hypothetical protein